MSNGWDTIYAPDPSMTATVLGRHDSPADCGERRLCMVMIEQAMADLATGPGPIREHARQWVIAEADGWPYAFEALCEVLGFDPQCLRTGLLAPRDRRPDSRRSENPNRKD